MQIIGDSPAAADEHCSRRLIGDVNQDAIGRTLTLHWNGTEWVRVPSQDPGTVGSELFGVTMIPGSKQACAVGDFFMPEQTLAELFG